MVGLVVRPAVLVAVVLLVVAIAVALLFVVIVLAQVVSPVSLVPIKLLRLVSSVVCCSASAWLQDSVYILLLVRSWR